MQTEVDRKIDRDVSRAAWLARVRAKELEPHDHNWSIESGTAHGVFSVFFSVYCWCGAWANKELSGAVYNVQEPLPEVRTRQFEKRLWAEELAQKSCPQHSISARNAE